jgi:DNA-binding protein HU-beta
MNKMQLVEKMAKEAGVSKVVAEKGLNSFLSGVRAGVKKGSVQLVGFGTFKKVKMKARKGINPQTGAAIKIPARTVMKFKASKNPKF